MAGAARLLALAGMGGFAVSAASRARRDYTAGLPGRMPGSVGRVAVRSRPRLAVSVAAIGGAIVAAGSVLTRDVDADALALVRPPQVDKPGWAARFREMMVARKAARR